MSPNPIGDNVGQLELAINRSVDEYLNTMLPDMNKLLEGLGGNVLENSQLSNFAVVTQDTGSVEVVKNYIRYQMGRDDKGRTWRKRVGPEQFGDRLIAAIDGLHKVAESFVTLHGGGLDEAQSQAHINSTWIALTRLYAGYMRRYLYYMNAQKGGGRPS